MPLFPFLGLCGPHPPLMGCLLPRPSAYRKLSHARLLFQRHLMICHQAALIEAEKLATNRRIVASARMGEPACAAYRNWARLQPQHSEVHLSPRTSNPAASLVRTLQGIPCMSPLHTQVPCILYTSSLQRQVRWFDNPARSV